MRRRNPRSEQIPPLMKINRRVLKLVSICSALAVLAVLVHQPVLRSAGWALVAEDPIEPADVIVVEEWTDHIGALEAADLYASGVADRVAVIVHYLNRAEMEMVRRGVVPADDEVWMTGVLRRLGVGEVEQISTPANGTEAAGQVLREWLKEHDYGTVVVVETNDHSRRARRIFRRALKGTPTAVIVRPSRYSSFYPDRWWKSRSGLRTGIVELQKLLLDIVRHPVS